MIEWKVEKRKLSDLIYCDVIVERWENLTGKKAELLNHATTI